jgi:hypothetical protein
MAVLSKSGKEYNATVFLYNFYRANKGILLLTIYWLIFKLYNYFDLIQRPIQLYEPMNYFARLLMPSLPSAWIFVSAIMLGIALSTTLLFRPNSIFLRLLLSFIVLWVNAFQWSWGFESVVSHTLLFSHLCTILISFKTSEVVLEKRMLTVKMIKLFYVCILTTYILSALWKWVGLAYKLFFRVEDINWLSDIGALSNALISFRNYDFDYQWLFPLFVFPFIWQFLFLLMSFLQTICLWAAFRFQLQPFYAFVFFIFHLVNSVVFNTIFITAPLVMVILFFPYHLCSKQFANERIYTTSENELIITYPNGDQDVYQNFEATREQWYQKYPLLSSILYLPGVNTIANIFYRNAKQLKSLLKKTKG